MKFLNSDGRQMEARKHYFESRLGLAGYAALEKLLDEVTEQTMDAPTTDGSSIALTAFAVDNDERADRVALADVVRTAVETGFLAGFERGERSPRAVTTPLFREKVDRNAAAILEAWRKTDPSLGKEERVQEVMRLTKKGRTTVYRHLRAMLAD